MNAPKQPGLFDAEKPTSVECAGGELAGLIADLESRGCVVLGMTAVCNATYRLALRWPDQDRARFARLT